MVAMLLDMHVCAVRDAGADESCLLSLLEMQVPMSHVSYRC